MVTKDGTTVTEKLLNDYELVFIVHPEVADDALDPIINYITQFITGKDGAIEDYGDEEETVILGGEFEDEDSEEYEN